MWGICLQKEGEEGVLVDLAVTAIEMLAQASAPADKASAQGNADAELGQGLSSGEMPAAQASVLYVLRGGVIEQLAENGQVCAAKLLLGPGAHFRQPNV